MENNGNKGNGFTPPPQGVANTNETTSAGANGWSIPAPSVAASNAPGVLSSEGKRKMNKTPVIIIGVVIIVLVLFSMIVSRVFPSRDVSETVLPAHSYIAQLYVVGEIGPYGDEYSSTSASYNHNYNIEKLAELRDDTNCKGLMIYMDTPGGTVYESEELYQAVKDFKEAGKKRPVYVYMSHYAASGGYYIAAAADKIFANKNTWTGSIGVIIGPIFDVKDLLNEHGVYTTEITSGKNKAMGSNYDHLTDEQKSILQSLVDEAYNDFVEVVAEGRKMSVEDVKRLADGRIYSSRQAAGNGLIDMVGTFSEAQDSIKEELGDDGEDIEIVSVERDGKDTFLSWLESDAPLISSIKKAIPAKTELQMALERLAENDKLVPMYLYKG